jgi:hypothetical protein
MRYRIRLFLKKAMPQPAKRSGAAAISDAAGDSRPAPEMPAKIQTLADRLVLKHHSAVELLDGWSGAGM